MDTGSSSCAVESPGDDAPTSLSDVTRQLLELDGQTAQRAYLKRCLHRFAADELLPFLKAESERYVNVDYHATMRLAESLVEAADHLGLPYYRALGRLALGEAFRVAGRYEEALITLEEAGNAFLAQGDEVGWARTRTNWLWASHYLGRGEAALAVVDRAREVFVAHQLWIRAAHLDYNTAHICREMGQLGRALALYDRAEAIYDSLGEQAELYVAYVKTARANLLIRTGDLTTALGLHEAARQAYLRRGDSFLALKQEMNIAVVHLAQGRFTHALRRFRAILGDIERTGSTFDAAALALDMVECYLSLNHNDEALDLALETARRLERAGTPTEAAKARFYGALAQARLGNTDQSLALLDQAAQTFAASSMEVQLGVVALQRACLYLDGGDLPAAAAEAEHAWRIFAERGAVVRQAQAEIIVARAAMALGDASRAAKLAQSALDIAASREVFWLAHEGHHLLGAVAQANGDLPASLEHYQRAVNSIESVQSTLAINLRSNFLEDKLKVYQDAIAVSLRLGQTRLAFAYLERAKSRSLVDYLASNLDVQIKARDGASRELIDTLARLREEHNWLYSQRYGYGLTRRLDGPPGTLDDEQLRSALRDGERRISRLVERLELDRTEGLVVNTAPDVDERNVVPPVEADEVLVEYYFDGNRGAAFVATPAGLAVTPLSARPEEIRQLLHQWHLNIESAARAVASGTPLDGLGRNARGILAALYRALLAPVAPQLAGARRLKVIPYGPTHAVPFHALYDGRRHLLESLEVSVCPSSNLLRLCTGRQHDGGLDSLVVAYSDGGRLSFVPTEARIVAQLLPGELYLEEAATRAAFIAAAPRHGVLHLAAHGEARLDNPAFAHLKLADGQLSTIDVFNLELNGALVTLSACETGRGLVTAGDELMGLSRGFLFAGASTLVQSLWRVEDGSTGQLMEGFYRALCGGWRKGAALRQAQLALLDGFSAHPYHWAPFQIIGDSGPL